MKYRSFAVASSIVPEIKLTLMAATTERLLSLNGTAANGRIKLTVDPGVALRGHTLEFLLQNASINDRARGQAGEFDFRQLNIALPF